MQISFQELGLNAGCRECGKFKKEQEHGSTLHLNKKGEEIIKYYCLHGVVIDYARDIKQ